jgi:hypothetical protein
MYYGMGAMVHDSQEVFLAKRKVKYNGLICNMHVPHLSYFLVYYECHFDLLLSQNPWTLPYVHEINLQFHIACFIKPFFPIIKEE